MGGGLSDTVFQLALGLDHVAKAITGCRIILRAKLCGRWWAFRHHLSTNAGLGYVRKATLTPAFDVCEAGG